MNSSNLPTVRTVSALRTRMQAWRERRERVAMVPTMGALHDGHLSLIRLAKAQAERVVCSIFVNPRQFGPAEDFEAYPRQEDEDARLLASERCDLIYAPGPEAMYPPGFATTISVGGPSAGLDGDARPGHFDGVATVVAKLLIQCAPDLAVFGEKDYQQLLVIRRLVADLDLTTQVLSAPTARAEDGLALSSRNAYLTEDERRIAGRMNKVLKEIAAAVAQGAPVEQAEAAGRAGLQQAGFEKVDYLEVRGAADLRRFEGKADAPARVFAAAWLGRTRLIDNWPV
jgi:pantoate--beta-alanine ligase